MSPRPPHAPSPASVAPARPRAELDRAWGLVVDLVMHGLDDWRRQVGEATGMPFSQVRALRRVEKKALTLRELADATGTDAPATTVIVNALELAGLVRRRPHPDDRRAKIVSITPAGKTVLATVRRLAYPLPESVAALPPVDVRELSRILGSLAGK